MREDLAGDETPIKACLSKQPPDKAIHAAIMSSVWIFYVEKCLPAMLRSIKATLEKEH